MPVLMFMAPYTFYGASVYTEAMFIMFIVLFFYFLSEKKYVLAGSNGSVFKCNKNSGMYTGICTGCAVVYRY